MKRRVKIGICILVAFFISQMFGTAPNIQTHVFYVQMNTAKVKELLTRRASYDVPTLTPTLAFGVAPSMSYPTSHANNPIPSAFPPTIEPPAGSTSTPPPGAPTSAIPTPTHADIPTTGPGTPTLRPPTPTTRPATPTQTRTPTPTTPNYPAPISCPSNSSESYDAISVQGGKISNAAGHGDVNLALRGYSKTDKVKDIIHIDGPVDPRQPPQLDMVLANHRRPTVIDVYRIHVWNFDSNTRGGSIEEPEVTMMGVGANPGETVTVPDSAYSIGDGKEVMVLYADSSRVTLKYMREDGVVQGYTMHVEDFCVDPKLVQKYNELNGSGRNSLPGLPAGKRLGVARTHEVKVVIRDTGSFMDPRGKKNWWQRY